MAGYQVLCRKPSTTATATRMVPQNAAPTGVPSRWTVARNASSPTPSMSQVSTLYLFLSSRSPTQYLALGTLLTLPGNNPVQSTCYEQYLDSSIPPILSPVHVHNGTLAPTATATVSAPSKTLDVVQTARGKCLWGVASGLPDAGDDGDDTSTDQTPDEKKPSASMKLDGTPLFVCFIVSWVVVLASLIGF